MQVIELSAEMLAINHNQIFTTPSPDEREGQQQQQQQQGVTLTALIKLRFEALYRMKQFDELNQEINDVVDEYKRTYINTNNANLNNDNNTNNANGNTSTNNNSNNDSSNNNRNRENRYKDTFPQVLLQMRLLVAEIKCMTGQATEALTELTQLRIVVDRVCKDTDSTNTRDTQDTPDKGGNIGRSGNNSHISYKRIRADAQFWWHRIQSAIVNIALKQRNPKIAVSELFALLDRTRSLRTTATSTSTTTCGTTATTTAGTSATGGGNGGNGGNNSGNVQTESEVSEESESHTQSKLAEEVVILSRLSRLLLQAGHVQMASDTCTEAEELCMSKTHTNNKNAKKAKDFRQGEQGGHKHKHKHTHTHTLTAPSADLIAHVSLTRGLSLFAARQYEAAMGIFTRIMDMDTDIDTDTTGTTGYRATEPETYTPYAPPFHQHGLAFLESDVTAAAVNGYAVSAIQHKEIVSAIQKLEVLVLENPTKYFIDPIVFNLCTLYDLNGSPASSTIRKQVLQEIAVKYNLQKVVNFKSYRMAN